LQKRQSIKRAEEELVAAEWLLVACSSYVTC